MRFLAPLALALSLAACQKAESSAPKVDEANVTEEVAAPSATAPAPAPAAVAPVAVAEKEDHACGCGMGNGGGCAECGGAGGCQMDMEEAQKDQGAPAALPAGTQWTAMTVDGMHCGGCAHRIEKALAGVDGIAAVDVDLTTHTVKIAGAPGADVRAIAAPKIDALGYHVE